MADARALLSASRQSRRVTHPYARYSEGGKLSCALCEQAVKTDAAWNGHVKTAEHAKRALRAADEASREAARRRGASRKRKAGASDEEEEAAEKEDARKRVRGDGKGEEEEEEEEETQEVGLEGDGREQRGPPSRQIPSIEVQEVRGDPAVLDEPRIAAPGVKAAEPQKWAIEDDPEWKELQNMLNVGEDRPAQQDIYANATLSAAPMSAEEIAARAREEQSTQRERRDLELEEEKEEVQEALQAEFDEMDGLETRVKKLREKREALRTSSGAVAADEARTVRSETITAADGASDDTGQSERGGALKQVGDEDDDDNDDDDDELDDWNFGAD